MNLVNRLLAFLKKRWLLILAVLLLLLGVAFYFVRKNKKNSQYQTYQITSQDLTKVITAPGKITAKNQITLKFQTAGQLSWVGVKKGDRVKKWQAIASLNQKELEKKLKQELLDYSNNRWDFDKTQKVTYKDQALTEAIRIAKEKSQFDLDRSVLDVEIANLAKKYAVLVSPIAGIVTKATDELAGINILPTTTEYQIVDPDSLRFTAEVEELDIGLIKPNQPAVISLDAFSKKNIPSQVGKIEFTAVETISGSTAYQIHFAIPANPSYRMDMNGDVQISTETKKNVLTIPVQAVISKENGNEVEILKNNKKISVPIETGLETDEFYEIVSGLSKGDTVILPQ